MKNKGLYIILGLLGVGGLLWYLKKKNTITTTTETAPAPIESIDLSNEVLSPAPTKQNFNVIPGTATPENTFSLETDINNPFATTEKINQMFINYNNWLNDLVNIRRGITSKFSPVTYQITKETQPVPSFPILNEFVYIWQDTPAIPPGTTISDAKFYAQRWVLVNKNQIT